jgi:single-strand DNA-binding protein
MRCTVWREVAEHVTESLVKGARVIVQGRLQQRSFETKDGEKRTVVELQVDEVGPSLRYATATVNRAQRTGTQQRNAPASQEPPEDPWASPTPASGGQGFLDEPPF